MQVSSRQEFEGEDIPAELAALRFDNRFTRQLPADSEPDNYRRQVHGAAYSRVLPASLEKPTTVAFSPEMAETLGLSPETCRSAPFAQVFSGNRLLPGMDPFAMCYGGHQFGHWAGQLGDGRAINLGEIIDRADQRWMLQLKGAGPTPYSRTADGLAVMRSSLREFLCSEAMHHLGVPTTRALSLVASGEQVLRDMFYDGHPRYEPGAIVCRVAPSFTRFGNFQIFASRQETALLRQLVDYTITTDFPHLGDPTPEAYAAWFAEVCQRTADLILHWTRVGFVHGVMNTDNMSILGLSIDYGPYGWLEDYDPDWTPNTTDAQGRRYSFGQQPQIALWNLLQLAQALASVFTDRQVLQDGLDLYASRFRVGWESMMAAKLGWASYRGPGDDALTSELHELLKLGEIDMTLFYRSLAELRIGEPDDDPPAEDSSAPLPQPFLAAAYNVDQIPDEVRQRTIAWTRRYRQRSAEEGRPAAVRRQRMRQVNPKFVLRNYLAQLAIDRAEQGDASLVDELLDVLRRPYDDQPDREQFAEKRPEWARNRAGCSMLSCSS